MPSLNIAILIAIGLTAVVWATSAIDRADVPDCQAVTVPAADYWPPDESGDLPGEEC